LNAVIELGIETTLIDLHTHSSCSDGSDRPAELIDAAHRAGITTIALTDHDTVGGVDEAARAAAERGVRFIAGVELALQDGNRHVHLLGLGFDHRSRSSRLALLLKQILERRVERNLAMVARMRQHGLAIDYAEVQAEARGASVGRPHMASMLVKRGLATDTADAFRRLLGSGRPFHVPRRAVPLRDAVDALREAGGHGVLAHPAGRTGEEIGDLLQAVRAAGVTGVEAYHPSLSRHRSALIRALADRLDLFVTGGSDYHGAHSPDRALGFWQPHEPIPLEIASALPVAPPPAEAQPRRR
jgi:predicted metal-dependent phosphoesterase TrpH